MSTNLQKISELSRKKGDVIDQIINNGKYIPKVGDVIQTITAAPASIKTNLAVAARGGYTKEEQEYFDDPLFKNVGGKAVQNGFLELEILDKLDLVDFFPKFKSTKLASLALENCTLMYYPQKVGNAERGLYFRVDLVLGGILDDLLEFFSQFLARERIVIRLEAYLGFSASVDAGFGFNQLILSGALRGIIVCYPPAVPLVTIHAAGVRLKFKNENDIDKAKRKRTEGTSGEQVPAKKVKTEGGAIPADGPSNKETDITKTGNTTKNAYFDKAVELTKDGDRKDKPEDDRLGFGFELYGDMELHPPGCVTSIWVNYTGSISDEVVHLKMSIKKMLEKEDDHGLSQGGTADSQKHTNQESGASPTAPTKKPGVTTTAPAGGARALPTDSKAKEAPSLGHLGIPSKSEPWESPFGVEGIVLWNVEFWADMPLEKRNKALADQTAAAAIDEGFSVGVKADFPCGEGWTFKLTGEFYSKSQTDKISFLEVKLDLFSFDILQIVCREVFDIELEAPSEPMEFSSFALRISEGKLSFNGQVKFKERLFSASLVASLSGVWVKLAAEHYELPGGFTIERATLDFLIGITDKEGKSSKDPDGTTTKDGDVAKKDDEKKENPFGKLKVDKLKADKLKEDKIKADKLNNPWDKIKADPSKAATTGEKSTTKIDTTKAEPKGRGLVLRLTLYGDVVYQFGPPESGHQLRSRISLSGAYTPNGFEFFGAARFTTKGSLRELAPKYIKENDFLDIQLTNLVFIATNVNNPFIPKDLSYFTITKGFYFFAAVEQVPVMEINGNGGKLLTKGSPDERAYIKIGWEPNKSSVPKIALFLPPSFKVNFSERFYTGLVYFQLDPENKPILSFHGELFMRMPSGKKPIKFAMELSADAMYGSLGMKLDAPGGINNPLNISDRITLYALKGSVQVQWAVLIASGTISGLGLGGKLRLGKENYEVNLRLGAPLTQTLIDIKASELDMVKIIAFISAVSRTDVPVPKFDFLSFHGVEMYASLGCTWLNDYYPIGMRFKGMLHICGIEASMDAQLTTTGFHLKTKIKGFKVGPLTVKGARDDEEDAALEIILRLEEQRFLLTGKVEFFGNYVLVDIRCAFLPLMFFYFEFDLLWTAGLRFHVKAEMLQTKRTEGQMRQILKPSQADWKLVVTFEQNVIEQVKKSIFAALDNAHKAAQEGIGAAQARVEEEKRKFDEALSIAQAVFDAEHKKHQDKIDALKIQIADQETKLNQVIIQNAEELAKAKGIQESETALGRQERECFIGPKDAANRQALVNKQNKENEGPWKLKEAQQDRDKKKIDFWAEFGDVSRNIDKALARVEELEQKVSKLDDAATMYWNQWRAKWWRFDLEVISIAYRKEHTEQWLSLKIAKGILVTARDVTNSQLYRDMKEAMESSARYFNTVMDTIARELQAAKEIADKALRELNDAINTGDLNFNSLLKRAQGVVDFAQAECKRKEAEQKVLAEKLRLEKQEMVLQWDKVGCTAAIAALDVARNNNVAVIIAQKALDSFSALETAAYNAIKGVMSAAMDSVVDIQGVSFEGTIKADKRLQKPFVITVKGKLGSSGKPFVFVETWMPGKTKILLTKLGIRAVGFITGADVSAELKLLEAENLGVEKDDKKLREFLVEAPSLLTAAADVLTRGKERINELEDIKKGLAESEDRVKRRKLPLEETAAKGKSKKKGKGKEKEVEERRSDGGS